MLLSPHPRTARQPLRGSLKVFGALVFLGTLVVVLGGALLLRRTPTFDGAGAPEGAGEAGQVADVLDYPSVGPGLDETPGPGSGPRRQGDSRDMGGAEADTDTGTGSDPGTVAGRVGAARPRAVTPGLERTRFEQRLVDVYRESRRSVVHVASTWSVRAVGSRARANLPVGTGSGFVWDENGYVVASYSSVKDVDSAWVQLADGSTWRAVLVGDAREYDIALLYIDAPRSLLRPVALGSARALEVGQAVLALGNPNGDEVLFFAGHVAGRDQVLGSAESTQGLRGVVLTDLALGRGMAGGPLLDTGGRLVGLRASLGTSSGGSFAIPVEVLNQVVPRIIQEGHVPWPELGLLLAPAAMAEYLGVQGVVVLEVVEGGPAHRAGLRSMVFAAPGRPRSYDLVVGIDDRPVRDRFDVDEALLEHEPGDLVAIDVLREGETLRFFVPLQ